MRYAVIAGLVAFAGVAHGQAPDSSASPVPAVQVGALVRVVATPLEKLESGRVTSVGADSLSFRTDAWRPQDLTVAWHNVQRLEVAKRSPGYSFLIGTATVGAILVGANLLRDKEEDRAIPNDVVIGASFGAGLLWSFIYPYRSFDEVPVPHPAR